MTNTTHPKWHISEEIEAIVDISGNINSRSIKIHEVVNYTQAMLAKWLQDSYQ
jgi:hypothetical protein